MKIKVLGTGCPKCKKLYAEAERAIAASGQPAALEKVEKIDDIMKYGVMMTPALVIDDEVKASGRIPASAEIVTWITTAAAKGIAILALLACASALTACKDVPENTNAAIAQPSSEPGPQVASAPADAAPDKVVVHYFHFTRRCPTCLGIQATIEKTIQERFKTETASGALTFQAVNLDLPENTHFAKDYNLGFSAMVVVAKQGETRLKWENCDKVWELGHDEPALTDYAEKRIRAYLDMLKKS